MFDAVVHSSQPFVGRTADLRQLHTALTSVLDSKRPQFVLIEGEFGAGKTALVEHFLLEIARDNLLIGQAKCAMESEGIGLFPSTQLLADLLEEVASRRIVPGSMTEFVKEVAPAWLDIFTVGTASK